MKKKSIMTILLIIVISLMVSGCDKKDNLIKNIDFREGENQTTSKEEEPKYGGELVLPITTIKSLNPLLSENVSYYYFSKLIFESLFELDNDMNVKNVLVEDYSLENGGKIVNINLRNDVFWHDGEKFTAEDVKFTIDSIKFGSSESAYRSLILSGVKPFGSSDIRHVLDVNVTGDYTLKIIFDKSYSNALEILTFPIIPKHRFAMGKSEKDSYLNALASNITPVGTGPYKFDEYEKLKTIKLKVNESWWKGKPYIETIIGKMLDDDELVLTSFETGQIDLANTVGIDWEKYAQSERVKIYEYIGQNYEFLAFNFSKKMFQGESGVAIRKAIAYGIDIQDIIQKVYLGHATQIDVPIHPNSWLVSEDANAYGYNTTVAKKILEDAGWTNVDGIYRDESGNKLSITLTTDNNNLLRIKAADMIAENLNAIGIEVIKDYNTNIPDKLTDEMINNEWEKFQGKISKGNFDVALLGWNLASIPDLSFAFHSSQIKQGTNFIRYSDEKMDELLVGAFSAPNRNMKSEAYKKLQNHIVEELPYVSLYFRNKSILVDKKIKGNISPTFFNIYSNIEEWYISSEYHKK
ncbi:peptide ABC transporter substrate-binding protein [Anaerosalibacter sp. Marseille-P3206]|uniref:peptide ABC transporter substrate-binding protein n=1 Tax=Anaerosalibacter sp. Marseille-P3206 TaxID=1871005 RepID=UPI000985166D|nr:peptide ABC transporter substrate-binding protein [Anaerosalibacter sp. Marseille-P3206]